MCDDRTVEESQRYLLSRRRFGSVASGAALMAVLPSAAGAAQVTESDVSVTTEDGVADCYFVHPSQGSYPGVIIWPDVLGLRPAFRAMGKRLAQSGYAVLVVNPYYRKAGSPVVGPGASFQDPQVRETVLPLARSLTAQTNVTDAIGFAAFLDAQAAVDSNRKLGTMGYCMGGPMTMRTAAALPDRIGAGASFHGGGLATDQPSSPHLLIPQMQASFLIAIAENDDERDPQAKQTLREAFDAADLAAEIEVYEGAMHGWCPPDSRVYHEAQAERAWARLLVLFEQALV